MDLSLRLMPRFARARFDAILGRMRRSETTDG
jgi:hypothetical protein